MVTVELNAIDPSPSALRFGGVVRYGEGGPVRFVTITVPDELLSPDICRLLLAFFGHALNRYLDSEPTEQDDPLF